MLVLSRKPGESLVLDGNIVVQVLDVAGNRVRLGIEAPEAIAVRRRELDQAPVPAAASSKPAFSPPIGEQEDLDLMLMAQSVPECVDPAERDRWLEWWATEGLQAAFD